MDSSPSPSRGLARRDFLHGAALAGAALATGVRAQEPVSPSAGNPVTLIRPAAPSGPEFPPLAPPDKQPPDVKLPRAERKLGWAIVGLGKLAIEEILPAFASCEASYVSALVSGHPEKAKKLAEVYHVESTGLYSYDTFARIADNPKVDVVYVVLPNSMHADFSIRALEAGKHVFCEKPMAISVAECEAMIAAAELARRKLGIAYRLHFEPTTQAVMEMARRKQFGEVKAFLSSNCQNVEAPNIRLSGPLGGGPVGDIGIYCINAARMVIGEEPLHVTAYATQPKSDPRFREVPESVSFLLHYPTGVTAACQCSFGTGRSSSYRVMCGEGTITMDPAFTYRGLQLSTQSEERGVNTRQELKIEPINQFAAEMDAFSRAIVRNTEFATPATMGLADMRIILAVLESARQGGAPVKV